jgi:hypothetical protein
MLHENRAALAAVLLLAAAGTAGAETMRNPASAHSPSVQTNIASGGNVIAGGCAGQLMLDPGLEATDGSFNNPNWTSTSTNFGTALCDSTCGGSFMHGGTFWAWMGGAGANDEVTTLSQTLTVTAPGPRYLNFFSRFTAVTPFNDTLVIKVDGNPVRTITEPTASEAVYAQHSVDISAFANNASHTFSFEFTHTADGGNGSSVHLDDITIDCAQLPVTLQGYKVD